MTENSDPRSEPVSAAELSEKPSTATDRPGPAPVVLLWETLAAGKRQVLIRFRAQTYQLRETRNGKLLLTK